MENQEAKNEALIGGSGLNAGLGAILTYTSQGRGGVCGQTIGADGSGDFSVLIYGTPDDADDYARDLIRRMKIAGYKIDSVNIVRNEEGFCGSFITTVRVPNVK